MKQEYIKALQREYIITDPAFKISHDIKPKDIVTTLANLLNRIRAGEVATEQASKESLVLSNLLKAYETVEVKAKLEGPKAIIGGRS